MDRPLNWEYLQIFGIGDRVIISHRQLTGFLFILLLASSFALRADTQSAQDLLQALRGGGYSLYFRHEATEWSQSDNIQASGDWLSCDASKIRQLSPAGRERAAATGRAIARLSIPIDEVLASPYCRTMETARLLRPGAVSASDRVINLRVADYFGGREAVAARTQGLLATPPKAGSNRIIVAHGNLASAATGVYPEEGEALIFRANGAEGFEFVGRLTAGDWASLAAASE